jgi:hypothetical protein
MPEPLSMLSVARFAGGLTLGAVRIATAPLRFAAGVAEVIVEEVADVLRPPQPPPDLGQPEAIRQPAARRRAPMGEPRPPVMFPGLLDPSERADLDGARGEDTAEAPPAPRPRRTPRAAPPPGARGPRRRRPPETAREPEPPSREPDGAEPPAADPVRLTPPAPERADTEEELVAEVADPGAEDGAGAELHVEEPWPGYRRLSATEVVDRLAAQDDAALSVLVLYESANRARKSVLRAAERELARRPAPQSR